MFSCSMYGRGNSLKAGRILELSEAEWEPAELQQREKVCIRGTRMLCYTEEGHSAVDAGLPWLRKSGGYTGASGSLSVAKGWLKQCLDVESLETTHNDIDDQDARSLDGDYDSSYSTFPAERPTRLLEILQSDDPNNLHGNSVRLIETNDHDYTYAALSYCWGQVAGTCSTNHDTIEQHLWGINLGSLPTTIQDCLQIAASLVANYV